MPMGRGEQRPYDDPFRYERIGRQARPAASESSAPTARRGRSGVRREQALLPRIVPRREDPIQDNFSATRVSEEISRRRARRWHDRADRDR